LRPAAWKGVALKAAAEGHGRIFRQADPAATGIRQTRNRFLDGPDSRQHFFLRLMICRFAIPGG